MARKISDQLRREAASLSKWGTHPIALEMIQKGADELDKRAVTIKKLRAQITRLNAQKEQKDG